MPLVSPVNPLALVNAAWRALRRANDRLRADHSTLARRRVRFGPHTMSRCYLYVAVAPSRRTERPWDHEQVARAARFARSFAEEAWTETPLTADAEVTTFGVAASDGTFERLLHVRRDGLVELLWALACEEGNGERALDALEIGSLSAALALAVAEPCYAELCRSRRSWGAPRRTDWHLAVATSVSTSDGQREWTRLRFPDIEPQRATNARAHMPPEGYGREALRSLRRKHGPQRVPLVLLRELLAANGYYGVAELDERLAAESLHRARCRQR